ncbi:UBP1-associated protein 2C-like [Magnolia sinica]|uniref:UBP1-associated protein 2C-like n=1 Tax=Magnolia sinica TaxID=86752 RepID=UPI00265AEDF9|nr:UBP1-associated protein 2C-like [Magnolia sinica]XP_058095642.1 UBP1-associated protein 2C-like [Magnolia sinica]XP_058095643.1 UBP1-associated protein 2C-like [Magnolia sinica]XP_058095644.1 UBP1-associated protein 2C-like [Magnolia sinica]XP_058095646.1 UBP1-associated protein 2C-like [Magnolia sinica]XP_058095647.1 UBP1-associated protein 2C-like [Magnolia sinica]XP_058095648.1 UBP1-associated protein 2C-like [Magnolia sinica]XP_058095649.1 UBP1-associated protein 2C-like [Magnolia sin
MDLSSKKRKADENGIADAVSPSKLTPEDARKIIEPFSTDQLLDILQDAVSRHTDVLDAVRSIADRDLSQRKLFIRGLGWDTTTDGLRSLFSTYGELEEAVVILDKATGKSKGYGFVTFKHIDGALLALKEPSKKIDGRMTVTQLAASGSSGPTANTPTADVSIRKIFVGNVPPDMPADRLLSHFSSYGEIEEGPLGFDKQTGKSRGFALFVYKTPEAAQASLVDPTKTIDGHHLVCKLAIDGKKGKPGGALPGLGGIQAPQVGAGDIIGDGVGLPQPSSMPSSLPSQYGGPGGFSLFGGLGFPGGSQGPGLTHQHLSSTLQSSTGGLGGPGLSSVGSQVPSLLGSGATGYGGGLAAGPYGSSQYGGSAAGGYGGMGSSSSLYRVPASSTGMPSGGYPESGHYGLSSSAAFQSQHNQQSGSSPAPRVPSGGMYQGMHPYY